MTDHRTKLQTFPSNSLPDDKAVRLALSKSQFVPFFQPLVTLRTGQLAGFEVLARWQHPIEGLIPPIRFIEKAEQGGWIDELTRQILQKAFVAAACIPDDLTLAINVSPFQLLNLQLPKQIQRMAMDTGFSLSRLIVEITESALIENLESAAAIVTELKAMGCRLALDDFGTGYSSLHHLQSLPFDELKVDRSFVSSMTHKRESRKIVSAVVGLGQSLGLITVAEGIETQEQAEMMLWLGCELGQGYFYGRPMPEEELAATLAAPRGRLETSNMSAWKRLSGSSPDVSPSHRLAQLQAVYDGAPVGLAFVDQKLRYLNLNRRLADMNGVPLESHLGKQIADVIPEYFPVIEPQLRRALGGEAVLDVETIFAETGQTRLSSYQPALDEAGEVVGVSISVADITDRKSTENALKASEAHYRRMVELNPQVLWIMDPQGRNLDVSPRWDKQTGLMKARSSDHKWLRDVHPDDMRSTIRAIAVSRRTASPINVSYRVAKDEGGWSWKRSVGAPRFDANGTIVCWYGSVQDIEDPYQAAEFIPEPAEKAAPSDMEDLDAERRHQALADLEILDTPPEAEFDDLVTLASSICAAPISVVSLVSTERQWFKASIGVEVCETPINVSFCAHAIRQDGLFLVEDASKDERFRENPMVVGDPHIRFYAGMPLYASGGIAIGTLCVVDTKPRTLSPEQAKALAILSHQVQARMELRSERGKLLHANEVNRELTKELQQANETLDFTHSELERLSTADSVTGILNRRAFEERLATEFANALRKQRPLSVLMIDVDNFERINDQCGHAAGDRALSQVGELLRKVIRVGDSAARIGPKEFAIVLPETTSDQAGLVADRVHELLGLLSFEGFPLITLSIGLSCLEEKTRDWGALCSAANQAMYQAKGRGDHKVVVCKASRVA